MFICRAFICGSCMSCEQLCLLKGLTSTKTSAINAFHIQHRLLSLPPVHSQWYNRLIFEHSVDSLFLLDVLLLIIDWSSYEFICRIVLIQVWIVSTDFLNTMEYILSEIPGCKVLTKPYSVPINYRAFSDWPVYNWHAFCAICTFLLTDFYYGCLTVFVPFFWPMHPCKCTLNSRGCESIFPDHEFFLGICDLSHDKKCNWLE